VSLTQLVRRGLLALGLLGPCLLASAPAASAAIYWNHIDDLAGERIARANLNGSNVDPDFIAMPDGENGYLVCEGIAVDATHIYWAENGVGAIGRANLDGSEADPWFITGLDRPCGLAIDSSYVYWMTTDHTKDQGSIGRAKLEGTNVQPEFLTTGYAPCGLARSGTELFAGELDLGGSAGLYRTMADGSGVPTLLAHANTGCGIAISGEYIYWTDFEGSIGRARLDGTQVDPKFIPDLLRPCGLAIHDGVLYWSEQPEIGNSGAISRANADRTDLRLGIVPNLRQPCGVAVDDISVPPQPESLSQPVRLNIWSIRHTRRTGVIFVAVKVSVAGSLNIHVPRQFRARILSGSAQVSPGRTSHFARDLDRPGHVTPCAGTAK
jgi:low-density lipoprotein receptor class B